MKKIELTQSDIEKFWAKVDKKGEDECWPWTGSRKTTGYGEFWISGEGRIRQRFRCNRIALYIKTGEEQETARHTCDNPVCCNPKHLEWGTPKDNTDDMMKRGRQVTIQDASAKLTREQVIEIRVRREAGESVRDIVTQFGVANQTVYDILNRKTWVDC